MSAANIQARIKRGLAKAVAKTGSADSEKVYLVQVSEVGGNTPLDPPTQIKTDVELVDAVFTNFDFATFGNSRASSGTSEILAGDRALVTNNDVPIKQGAIIKQGSSKYMVISTNIKAPTSDVLAYITQVRLQ